MCTFLGLGGSPTPWLHTQKPPIIESELTLKLHLVYMFHVSCICTWDEQDFYSFQYARIDRVNKGRVNARRWPGADAVVAINSSAAPAFRQRWTGDRVDFGKFYTIKQYLISYMYMYYNQPSMSPPFDVTNSIRPLLLPSGKSFPVV